MRIFNLEIVRHSHYEHLLSECAKLSIENIKLNKEFTYMQCLARELKQRLSRNIKRDKQGRFIKDEE